MSHKRNLIVQVKETKGQCPVYRAGDSFQITEGFILKATVPICLHSLASLMPYYVALSSGVGPVYLRLAREGESAFVQCLDPCELTGGGTVIFEIKPE